MFTSLYYFAIFSIGISPRMSPQSIHSANLTINTGNQQGNSGNRRMSLASLKSFTLMLPAVPETDDSEATKVDSINVEENSSAVSMDIVVNMESQPEEIADENDTQIKEGVETNVQKCEDAQNGNETQIGEDTILETDQASKMVASMPIIDDLDSKPRKSISASKSKSLNHLDALPSTHVITTSKKKHWNSWSSFMSIVNKRLPIITRSYHNLSFSTTNTVELPHNTTKPPTGNPTGDNQNDNI